MNKTELQQRIEKCESELAALKSDLAKCDDGIEQEKCWHVLNRIGEVITTVWRNKNDAISRIAVETGERIAYMPECRAVTAEDAEKAFDKMFKGSYSDSARELHKLGFRIKVSP